MFSTAKYNVQGVGRAEGRDRIRKGAACSHANHCSKKRGASQIQEPANLSEFQLFLSPVRELLPGAAEPVGTVPDRPGHTAAPELATIGVPEPTG